MTARSRWVTRWITRAVLSLLWLALTAGVAFYVARNAESDTGLSITDPLPRIDLANQTTVTLSERIIAPVISGDGLVIEEGGAFLIDAPIADDDLAYRLLDPPLGVKALIAGGPAGFDCPWAGLGVGGDGVATMRCRVPAEVRVAAGLSGTMVLQVGPLVTAQALPLTAVLGESGQGQVVVVNADGTRTVTPVTLGAADAIHIEITGGLAPDATVIEYPTQRDLDLGS